MSMMVSFVLSFFPRDVLDEILNLIESVSEDFPSYSYTQNTIFFEITNIEVFFFFARFGDITKKGSISTYNLR